MATVVNSGGITDRLICVLSYSKWQTGAIMACQITFPPDAIARISATYARNGKTVNDPAADIVTKALSHMYQSGTVERRVSESGAFEYRLLKGFEDKCKLYSQRIKHDAYHKGYVRKSEYSNQKRFSEITAALVLRGILVEELDGNFLLNANISTERKSNECT